MARPRRKPHQLLAESLKTAKSIASDSIIQTEKLSRVHRERLEDAGCLTKIVSGWYLLTSPDAGGESTAWYGGFWAFLKHYLSHRFGNEYCFSAESSLSLHAGDTTIPNQIIILTKKDSNTAIDLLHGTSIFLRTDTKNFPSNIESFNGVSIMSLISSLCRLTQSYYEKKPRNVEIVLKMATLSVAEISRTLLRTEALASAERLIGAFSFIGEESKAKQILQDLTAAGYKLTASNPFEQYAPQLTGQHRISSPYAGRIRLMWNIMRKIVLSKFPDDPGLFSDKKKTIEIILETYIKDAYHSLSIEGYHVTEELIEKIENGKWEPESINADKQQMDAMAAKGYSNSFDAVVESVRKILNGRKPGEVLEEDLQTWYRELFATLFKANLLDQEKLAGYRNNQVYITNSRHVPPPKHAVLDCMEVLFDLLKNEPSASVRAVLGHFIFVYIHPYMDGNGRMGRFILNLMLISGGFNWTIIRVERRKEYMTALEKASTEEDIEPFTIFVLEEVNHWKKKQSKKYDT